MAKLDRQISKQMRAAGWILVSTKGKHEKWICGCGEHGPIIKSTTIGEGRGAKNFAALMRRQGDCSVNLKLG